MVDAFGVRLKPTGPGQQTRMAWVPADRLPGFRLWLESLIGTLALFEVVEHPEPPPSPSAPRPEPPRAPPPADSDEPLSWEPGEADLADQPLHAEGWWRHPLEPVPVQGSHEGDTEMMDLRRNEDGTPEDAFVPWCFTR